MWGVGLAAAEDGPGEQQQLPHGRSHADLGALARGPEAVGEGAEGRE